jgi:hypothetical protein
MNAPHDLDRQLDAFLRDGPTELPDSSFDAVRDRMEQTRQRVVIGPWRMPDMNKIVPIGLGAAAVVVALVVGSQYLRPPAPGGVGSAASASPSPTAEPSPSPSAWTGLPAGPHVILTGQEDDSGRQLSRPLTVTIPAPGWNASMSGVLEKNEDVAPNGLGMIIFTQPEYIVYGDACHWRTTIPETPVTTVDAFVDALSSQGSRDASEPVDITLGGYAGKSITLQVPADVDFTKCDPGHSGSWDCGGSPCGYHGSAGAVEVVYVLDVDGLVMAWVTEYYEGAPTELVAELEAIVQSASFGE